MALVQSVNYATKRIYLSAATMNTEIDTIDIYKEIRALRRVTEAHRNFKPMIVAGGNIEKIPGVSATPIYVQLLYGCRIVPYNQSHSLKVIRDTFTDDGVAGRDCFDRTGLSVGVVVNIDVDFPAIEIRKITSSGNEYSLEQISTEVQSRLNNDFTLINTKIDQVKNLTIAGL